MKNNSGKVFVIVIIVLAVLALGGLAAFWIFLTPGYISRDKAVENYYNSISNGDAELYKNTCFTKKWQENYSSKESGSDIDTIIKEAFDLQSGATYGDVKITAMEKLDKEYAENMTNIITDMYGINVKVSSISKVNFEVDTKFEGEKVSSGTITRYCYKSGGKWFFLSDPDVIVLLDIEG